MRKAERNTDEMILRLVRIGIDTSDAWQLRRISMTLHRWHEMECGVDGGCIQRDEKTGKPFWNYSGMNGSHRLSPIADRERGAQNRLAKIMSKYPTLLSYIQGDPRGASLYILRPGDVPAGESIESYYSRGVAVYR